MPLLLMMLACESDSAMALQGECADCHSDHADALEASTLSRDQPTRVFRALQREAGRLHGPAAAAQCDACHAPTVGHEGGLSCLSCHAAVGQRAPDNGALIHETWGPVQGTRSITDSVHEVQESPFLQDAALCGTCHEVRGPGALVETPYTHWTDSPAAQEGVGCADCHMPDGEHSFPGLNGDPQDALALLQTAVRLEALEDGSVRLENLGRGHDLPDGAAFVRTLSVEWRADGQAVGEDPLTPRFLDREGREVQNPLAGVEHQERSIPAGESRDFPPPAGTQPDQACVVFQQLDPELLDELGLPQPPDAQVLEVACVAL